MTSNRPIHDLPALNPEAHVPLMPIGTYNIDKNCDPAYNVISWGKSTLTSYHETISRPSRPAKFMIFVTESREVDSDYSILSTFSSFRVITKQGSTHVWVLDYLGSIQSNYDVFQVKRLSSTHDEEHGLMAVRRAIYFPDSATYDDSESYVHCSVPDAFLTTVPVDRHYYAIAAVPRTGISCHLSHKYPRPIVSVIDED